VSPRAKHRFSSFQFCPGGFSLYLSARWNRRYLAVRGKVNDQIETSENGHQHPRNDHAHFESREEGSSPLRLPNWRQASSDGHISIYNIYFAGGKADLKAESKTALDEVAQLLKNQPTLKAMVVGTLTRPRISHEHEALLRPRCRGREGANHDV